MANQIFDVLRQYDLPLEANTILPFGNGLINTTYTINCGVNRYILQALNLNVFKHPEALSHNLESLSLHLTQHYPSYFLPLPVRNVQNNFFSYTEDGKCFRLTEFVDHSHSSTVVSQPNQAYEAAFQFGRFSHVFSELNVQSLQTTIPQFHDLSFRFQQFKSAENAADEHQKALAGAVLKKLTQHAQIITTYERFVGHSSIKMRTTHHDTKISNVLFDASEKGNCVIDLDTAMPGYFISDVGDMMRTYLCPEDENSINWDDIHVRPAIYQAITEGYLSGIGNSLNTFERQHFFYAGAFMIYMQALRFATDHLMNDCYYGTAYPNQNLMRAQNQLLLLEQYLLTPLDKTPTVVHAA